MATDMRPLASGGRTCQDDIEGRDVISNCGRSAIEGAKVPKLTMGSSTITSMLGLDPASCISARTAGLQPRQQLVTAWGQSFMNLH